MTLTSSSSSSSSNSSSNSSGYSSASGSNSLFSVCVKFPFVLHSYASRLRLLPLRRREPLFDHTHLRRGL